MIVVSNDSSGNNQTPSLGGIDWSKNQIEPSLFIAKPDGTIIGKMPEAFDVKYTVKLGNINELEIWIPYEIERNHQFIVNPNIAKLLDKYLIKFVAGNYEEWFMIDQPVVGIEDEKNYRTVTCYSLGYELNNKVIQTYNVGTSTIGTNTMYVPPVNCTTAMNAALQDTLWNVGEVDAKFDTMYRSYSISSQTSLSFILSIANTLQAIAVFNTLNRTIDMRDPQSVGTDKGLRIGYGKYGKVMKKSTNHDNFCTRLLVNGQNGISINSVTPTGQAYIEDFSFFMQGYEEDSNGNVISSSPYMSDGLCHAMIQYASKLNSRSGDFQNYLKQLTTLQNTLARYQDTDMAGLNAQLTSAQSELDVCNSTNVLYLGNWSSTIAYAVGNVVTASDGHKYQCIYACTNSNPTTASNPNWNKNDGVLTSTDYNNQIISLNQQIANKQTQIDGVNSQIGNVMSEIYSLQDDIKLENNFTVSQIVERMRFTIEKEYNDTTANTPTDLLAAAQAQLKSLNAPTDVVTIDIVNFLEVVEAQRDWDKLNIGDIVYIDYPQYGTNVKAKITQMEINFNGSQLYNDCVLTIANFQNILTDEQRLIDLLYRSASTSTTVSMNSFKWDSVDNINNQLQDILTNSWDANKRAIIAGVNESVRIDNRGITIKDPNDQNNYLVAQHGILAITNDGGNTWKNAITKDGIIAERVFGQLIVGEGLEINATDSNGTSIFMVNSQGVQVVGSSFSVVGGIATDMLNQTDVGNWNGAVTTANNALNVAQTAVQLGTNYQGVSIDATNGILATMNNDTIQVQLSAGTGFSISQNVGTVASPTWHTLFLADTNGGLWANNMTTTALKIQTGDATPVTLIDASTKTINFTGFNVITGTLGSSNIPYLDASKINTGTLNANSITISGGGITIDSSGLSSSQFSINSNGTATFSGTVTGANITSGSKITVGTDLVVGNNIWLGGQVNSTTGVSRTIYFNGSANINGGTGLVGADMTISCDNLFLQSVNTFDFGGATIQNFNGGITAVFG